MIWYGTSKDIKLWFKKVFKQAGKDTPPETFVLNISEKDIE